MNTKKLKYIDIFAGCGGFSLGLYNTGLWEGLFAIEKNPMAFQTLKYNLIDSKKHFSWPDWLPCTNQDINKIINKYKNNLIKLKDSVDLVVGGPPCQGFSTAGRRKENDKRNKLVYAYLEFIKIIKPKTLIFENVKGFNIGFKNKKDSCLRNKPYSSVVLEELHKIGYKNASFQIINFSDFGIPQERKRIIIFASLEGIISNDFFLKLYENKNNFLKNKDLLNPLNLGDVISDLEMKNGFVDSPDTKGFKAGIYKNINISNYQYLMRYGNKNEIPDSHRFVNHTYKITLKFREIIEKKLNSKEVQEKYNTKKSRTCLLNKNNISPTLTTLPDDYVHYSEPRILTVREYARIQTFPDWFEFKGKYTTGGDLRVKQTPRYTQVGNAIPPLFTEQCGIVLEDLING